MTTSVFLSGASGFIAQHLVQQLIQKGYRVVGTVRSAEKGDQLKANLKSDNFVYEIVEEIATPNAFDEALKKHPEVTVFLHTASPFHFNATDVEKELLIPAVEGTKNALSSIKKFGPQIKKVVITSSVAAMSPKTEATDPTLLLTEESWNPTTKEETVSNAILGYRGSKTFAELAAWEFMKTENPHFTLNTVNPTFVFGPQAFQSGVKDTLNTSSEVFNAIIKAGPEDKNINNRVGGYIDVRDVARAHIHAFESDVTNFRYYMHEDRWTTQAVLDIINENIPALKGKVAVGKPGTGQDLIDQCAKVDNSKTKKYLGDFIPLKKIVIDSFSQLAQ